MAAAAAASASSPAAPAGMAVPSVNVAVVVEEDAAKKKSTDCVYFLASPLTCKKGNDCEFRHSEQARLNPRDCYYWINTHCLNRDCPFRHPPLDGRPTTPSPSPVPAASKAGVPCYFYQQGCCTKGGKCPFSHGPAPAMNHNPTAPAKPAIFPAANGVEVETKQASSTMHGAASKVFSAPGSESSISKVKAAQVGELETLPYAIQKVKAVQNASAVPIVRLSDQNSSWLKKPMPVLNTVQKDAKRLPAIGNTAVDVSRPPKMATTDSSKVRPMQMKSWGQEERQERPFESLANNRDPYFPTDEIRPAHKPPELRKASIQNPSRGMHLGESTAKDDYNPSNERRMHYDHHYYDRNLSSVEQNGSDQRLSRATYNDMSVERAIPKEKAEFSMEERGRSNSRNDLRNRIGKRRRDERTEQQPNLHAWRDGIEDSGRGPQQKRRQDEIQSKYNHDIQMHSLLAPDRKNFDRDVRGRCQSAERGLDLGNIKIRGDYRTEKLPFKNSGYDHSQEERVRKVSEKVGIELPPVSELRNAAPVGGYRNIDMTKDANFAGPKTLAQIKAEKMKSAGTSAANGHASDRSREHPGSVLSRIGSDPVAAETSQAATNGLARDPRSKHEPKNADFKSPKPLSVILKEKQKLGSSDEKLQLEEADREIEDGELVPEGFHPMESVEPSFESRIDTATPVSEDDQNTLQEGPIEVSEMKEEESLLDISDKNRDDADNRLSDEELEDAAEFEERSDYELDMEEDDEDDDFAKKLGGFFS